MTQRFTWDANKAAINQRKHHVSFEIAARVLTDPFALTEQDRVEEGEYRWITIGSVEGILVPVVAQRVHDEEDGTETIHIISARRANRPERRRYEQEKYSRLRT